MPIKKVYSNKKGTGYKWGSSGKTYFGKSGKSKAEKQMKAIYSTGYKGK